MSLQENIHDEDLVRNKEQRSPCMLVLDTSASMRGAAIEELNEGLRLFQDEVRKDPLAAVRCEIAIVTCVFAERYASGPEPRPRT